MFAVSLRASVSVSMSACIFVTVAWSVIKCSLSVLGVAPLVGVIFTGYKTTA